MTLTPWRRLRGLLRRVMFRPVDRTAPLDSVRCNDKPIARDQGFGGGPIESFPVYRFFRSYLEDPEAGRIAFRDWYWEWFVEREGWRFPKREGGLAGGSLHRTVDAIYRRRHGYLPASPTHVEAEILEEAIDTRIRHYFSVLESIREAGFDPRRGSPILALGLGDLYYLRNGHHRAAALAVLGHSLLPLTVVNELRFLQTSSLLLWQRLR